MKRKKYTSKPGTIGREIEKLIARYNYPMGHYILAATLEKLSGCNGPVMVGKQLYSQTPGYMAALLDERKCYGRMGILFPRPDDRVVVRYTPAGDAEAVLFPAGMTADAMREEAKRGDTYWQAYNEADKSFLALPKVKTPEPCDFCAGTGNHPYHGKDVPCNACRGTGKARPLAEVQAETEARMHGE